MGTPGRSVATTLYTNDGQPDLVTDPRGSVTDYVYNTLGQVQQVIAGRVAIGNASAANQTLTYSYDANGRVTVVTDGRNQPHTLPYDAFGRLEWEQDPLGNKISYQYDKLDRLEEQVVGVNTPDRYTHAWEPCRGLWLQRHQPSDEHRLWLRRLGLP